MPEVAIVTGGTRGIGAAISTALAAAGRVVVATYVRDEERAAAFAQQSGTIVRRCDVADPEACASHVEAIKSEYGPVDILVNNAGITRDSSLRRMSRSDWDAVIGTNLSGVFNMTRAVWPGMLARKYGRIVSIASINGQAGQIGQVNYSAAKSALHGFTKSLAQEGGPAGITVNAIAPGYVDTEMVAAVRPEVLQAIVARIPVGRLGRPEEIARAVLFLSAREAGFITGSTLSINGGQLMH